MLEFKSKLGFITRDKYAPSYLSDLRYEKITEWYCCNCLQRQSIEYNPDVTDRMPYSTNWIIKCKVCRSEIVPEIASLIYNEDELLRKKWFCEFCDKPTKIRWNKIWLKLPTKIICDKREIIGDNKGAIASCSVCGVIHTKHTSNWHSDFACPICGWANNERDYIGGNGKEYPRYEGKTPCYEGGEDWDEVHYCNFCKEEFLFWNSSC